MTQLHLGLRPGQGGRARTRSWLRGACRAGRARPRATSRRLSKKQCVRSLPAGTLIRYRSANTGSKTFPRYRTTAAPSITARGDLISRPRPRKRARSVSNSGSPNSGAFEDRVVGRPDVRLIGRAFATRCEERVALRDVFRLNEKLRERLMRRVCRGRREHELQIGRDLDLPVAMAAVGDRQSPNFGVVFRRYDDLQGRRDRPVRANEFRAVLGKGDLVGLRLDPARLKSRRPDCAAPDIPQEDVAPVSSRVTSSRQRVTARSRQRL